MCETKAHPDHSGRSDLMMFLYCIAFLLTVGAMAIFGDRFHAHPSPPATHADADAGAR